jgi:glutamine cyclotransferase
MDLANSIKQSLTLASAAAVTLLSACSESVSPPPPATTITNYTYRIVNEYPHDEDAPTQGLVYVDSVFVEGTGLYMGSSTLRRVEVETGRVLQIRDMPEPQFFGEGVAVWGDTIVQLTWASNEAVIYENDSFTEIGRFDYPTLGWGLTHDGNRFIMSDGTDTLYFRDKRTFAEVGRVTVIDNNGPVTWLNELEYIDGMIYANIFQSDVIVAISPTSGRVRGRISVAGLGVPRRGVPNGIAYDAENGRLFVTGKLWRTLYEIELVEQSEK